MNEMQLMANATGYNFTKIVAHVNGLTGAIDMYEVAYIDGEYVKYWTMCDSVPDSVIAAISEHGYDENASKYRDEDGDIIEEITRTTYIQ